MGQRYGGLKQVEAVGPAGETILDYSVYDALGAGFNRVLFVIRRDMEKQFRDLVARRIESHAAVDYAYQSVDLESVGIAPPTGRSKPWGTGQAVLAAEQAVAGPFVVVNADDFYGAEGFAQLAEFMRQEQGGGVPTFAMIGYRLRDTLPDAGAVSRAVCRCTSDGWLDNIEELSGIERDGPDARYRDCAGQLHPLSGGELVSMNLWAFTPAVFDLLREGFRRFLDLHGASPDAEFHLPSAIGAMIRGGAARVRVLPNRDAWCGVTHRNDKARVAERIRDLIAQGVYPPELWV